MYFDGIKLHTLHTLNYIHTCLPTHHLKNWILNFFFHTFLSSSNIQWQVLLAETFCLLLNIFLVFRQVFYKKYPYFITMASAFATRLVLNIFTVLFSSELKLRNATFGQYSLPHCQDFSYNFLNRKSDVTSFQYTPF